MRLLEVYIPEIDVYVRYKVMDATDVDSFVEEHGALPRDEYIRVVLETLVFNLKSEISDILRKIDKKKARGILASIYNGCIMLNPGIDVDEWVKLATSSSKTNTQDEGPIPPPSEEPPPPEPKKRSRGTKAKSRKITKAKFLGLESHLKSHIVGQDEAIGSVVGALKRSIVGLADEDRPLGVFLFAGASGVGKTHLAKELHQYLFGSDFDLVRIDCGEYQHKHENQKLIGSPPGYVGHDEGGHLTNQMKKNSHTVVLLDEVEKAHPDLWNTFLRVFDEGKLTDNLGSTVSFRDSIIIMTTNLGNKDAVNSVLDSSAGFGGRLNLSIEDAETPPRERVERYTKKAIRKSFTPEFLNRIDKTVVFNHLAKNTLTSIAELELGKLEDKLKKRGISLSYSNKVLSAMIAEGVNPIEGARGLARVRRESIEDAVSDTLIQSARWPRGTVLALSWDEDGYSVTAKRPARKKKTTETKS